ncbi:MAG TPA: UDP-N-acetylmuramoyl-L-alanine--D-glutamate ligase [Rhodanobacteraceae bacterium]
MKFATLEGRRVAVWGYGREGRAALTALRRHLPHQSVTLFCSAAETADIGSIDGVELCTVAPDADVLSAFDIVIKSPGISLYKPEIVAARAAGTMFTSGTALWFGEHPQARVVGITGTKGKSTTSALLAHLARALGVRTALAGNIGLPLLELDGQHADLWVVELSSFQTGEAGPLALGIVTSLYAEHLDWHGSVERYQADKLKLADVSRQLLVNALQPTLLGRTATHAARHLFGLADGWHVEPPEGDAGASALAFAATSSVLLAGLPLHGRHNALNACAALTALDLLGFDAHAALPALADFRPLPHRLQALGRAQGLEWVNDSISTTPQAALAALESLGERRINLILGGHDRGLDWSDFARRMASWPLALRIITQGANGPRIARQLRAAQARIELDEVHTLDEAVICAVRTAQAGDVVLLSPGAPSFDQFHDYAARGCHFAELAGFDGRTLGNIAGLGIH